MQLTTASTSWSSVVGGLSSLSAPPSQVLLLTGSSCSYTSGEVADVAVSPMDVAKLLEGLLQPKLRVKWLLSCSRSLIAEFLQIHDFSVVSVAESQALGCYLVPRVLLVWDLLFFAEIRLEGPYNVTASPGTVVTVRL